PLDNNQFEFDNIRSSIKELELGITSNSEKKTEKTLIIKYKDNFEKDKIFKSISSLKGEIVNDLLNLKYLIVKLPKNYVPEFKRQKFTFYADKLEKVISDKEDLLDTSQFQKINQEEYTAPINLINGQNLISDNYKGKGVKIAILDTGIDPLHPDLKDNLNFSKSFVTESNGYTADEDEIDGHGHGTHVAVIAAGNGVASNGKFIGVAPEADIYNLKVVSQYGAATIVATLLAIEEAILKEIDIISLSLGFEASNPDHPLSLALDDAVNNFGIHVTVSAGNSGPEKNTISTPAAARSVISVGAAYSNKSTTYFSSRGLNTDYRYDPDITAPGYQVISTLASSSITDLSEKYFDPTVIMLEGEGSGLRNELLGIIIFDLIYVWLTFKTHPPSHSYMNCSG
ncbi:MAG: S8 family serine peptidase, partial [Candidatus Heimdallarchaeota archaeon]